MADDNTIADLRCSFCGKDQNQVRKLIAGPKVYICDECIDLCNDIIAGETESPDDEASPPPISTTPGVSLVWWEVVTRYANTNTAADYTLAPDGVDWMCEGCGWRLRLKPDAKPPREHSEQVPLGRMGGPYRKLPPRELVPRCPNPEWKKFP